MSEKSAPAAGCDHQGFVVAQVTPYTWESGHQTNSYIARLTAQLNSRGHRAVVLAPTESDELLKSSKALARSLAQHGSQALWQLEGQPVPVLGIGEPLKLRGKNRSSPGTLSVKTSPSIESLLKTKAFDFVHVHEPFAPSVASAALRHSHALNIGSFHLPTERTLSTQVARRLVELLLGRLDARTVSFEATGRLMERFFPADYRLILPAAQISAGVSQRKSGSPPLIVFCAQEERAAARLLIRALRRLPTDTAWQAAIWEEEGASPYRNLPETLTGRVEFLGPESCSRQELLSRADITVHASAGTVPDPATLLDALAVGAVPLAARLEIYEELLGDGEHGLLFGPGDIDTLSEQLTRLVRETATVKRLQAAGEPSRQRLTWERVAEEFVAVYEKVASRRHTVQISNQVRNRLKKRPLIDVDLHMHTDHSHDCATPVEVLLATAKQRQLGAIAVTDHNEISGALEAAAKAEGIKVIVGEEVKTKNQGEVIGLFIKEKIPKGLTLQETVAEIKRQGGVVYVPHPFDRMHAVPDYRNLLEILDDVDAIEVFNPRVAFSAFNEEAVRFAEKYRITAGAGSDSHVAQGLGSVRIKMRDFDGPEEFLASLREADIIRKPKSLFYVQALKFLQTKATPAPMRRASRERRIRRAKRTL